MRAWTADKRLTLIKMLCEEIQGDAACGRTTLRAQLDLIQHLAGSTGQFLDLNRNNFKSVITRYNEETAV